MSKSAIIYGSTTGVTEDIAHKIASVLHIGDNDIYAASDLSTSLVDKYDILFLGSSTWGCGDLQDDWYDAIDVLKKANLSGKKIALFGTGDSAGYGDTFCDAMGVIYNDFENSGAEFIGYSDAADYTFESSTSVKDGKFVGLAIDEMNEPDKTDERISKWVTTLNL